MDLSPRDCCLCSAVFALCMFVCLQAEAADIRPFLPAFSVQTLSAAHAGSYLLICRLHMVPSPNTSITKLNLFNDFPCTHCTRVRPTGSPQVWAMRSWTAHRWSTQDYRSWFQLRGNLPCERQQPAHLTCAITKPNPKTLKQRIRRLTHSCSSVHCKCATF